MFKYKTSNHKMSMSHNEKCNLTSSQKVNVIKCQMLQNITGTSQNENCHKTTRNV